MANFNINNKKKKVRIFHPSFLPNRSGQVRATSQTVTPTGSSIAIRPMRTAIRRMDNRGQGSVGYI